MADLSVELVVKAIDMASAPLKEIRAQLTKTAEAAKLPTATASGFARLAETIRAMGSGLRTATAGIRQIGSGLSSATGAVTGFGLRVAGLTGLTGGAAAMIGRSFLTTAMDFERFESILTTVEGSSEQAKKSLAWVSKFARTTPYDIQQATEAFVAMRVRGMDPTSGSLRKIGDAASALGVTLEEGVFAVARAATGEYESLKRFGFTAMTKGNQVRLSYTDKEGKPQNIVAKRGQGVADAVVDVLGQKFAGGMERQAKTLGGKISNLDDAWTEFKLSVMRASVFDSVKDKVSALLDAIDRLSESGELQRYAQQIAQAFEEALSWVWENRGTILDAFRSIGSGIKDIVVYLGGLKNAAKTTLAVLAVPSIVQFGSALVMLVGGLRAVGVGVMAAFGPIPMIVGAAVAQMAYFVDMFERIQKMLPRSWGGSEVGPVEEQRASIANEAAKLGPSIRRRQAAGEAVPQEELDRYQRMLAIAKGANTEGMFRVVDRIADGEMGAKYDRKYKELSNQPIQFAPNAGSRSAYQPQAVSVGGSIAISVSDDRVKVKKAVSTAPGFDLDVFTGPALVMP